MKNSIYIFGHTNPDTDSICSAIAYCDFKRELGETNVEVYRLGNLSKETKFVLDHFGIPEPKLLKDVKAQLSDLPYYNPVTVSRESSLAAVWETMMTSSNSHIIAILNEERKLEGIISKDHLTRVFMEHAEEALAQHEIAYNSILDLVQGYAISSCFPSELMTGKFHLGCEVQDLSEINRNDVVIISGYNDVAKFAGLCGCILVSDKEKREYPDANKYDCCIIQTDVSIFTIVSLLIQSISVGSIMKSKDLECFTLDNYIEDVIEATKVSVHRNFPVLDNDGRLAGIISRRHLIDYNRKKVILVDHNERHQSVNGIEQADILEIIDHHRVANVHTLTPPFIRSEPVGATATIIFKMYMENFLRPKKEIAGIMLSAILSDTLIFNSPTCTKDDKEAAYKLAKLAGVDLDDYGELMFRESAVFDDYTDEALLSLDRKEFTFGRNTAYISQVNTIDFRSVENRQESILKEMQKFKKKTGANVVLLVITDIIENGSKIMGISDNHKFLEIAFGMSSNMSSVYLPGVVSRKKQVVPMLMKGSQL